MQLAAHADEVAVAGAVAGREALDGFGHRRHVFLQVEHGAVVEEAAPLRVEPAQVEVVVHVPPGFLEDALQHGRDGQDGRPHVEAEAVLFQHRRLAAEPGVLVEQDHLVAARRQRAGRGQAAQPGADHADRQHATRRTIAFIRASAIAGSYWGCAIDEFRAPIGRNAEILRQQPRGDARALENDRQAAARMRAAADQIDPVEILEPVARAPVQHLPDIVRQVEGGAAEHLQILLPTQRRQDLLEADARARCRVMPIRSSRFRVSAR